MRDWLCKIICRDRSTVRENNDTDREWDIEARVRDLRRRIEEQKRAVGYYTSQPTIIGSNGKILEQTQQQNKDPEIVKPDLDDLKAKLLGKKK